MKGAIHFSIRYPAQCPARGNTCLRQQTHETRLGGELGLVSLAASLLLAVGLLFGGAKPAIEGRASALSLPRYKYETRNIEELQVGDKVLARDDKTGEQALKAIDRTYQRVADHLRILTIRSADGAEQTLKTTDEHPFWVVDRGWVNAGDLTPGQCLLGADSRLAQISSTLHEPHPEGIPVINLRVVESHTYFAAQDSGLPPVLVHNANYEGMTAKAINQSLDLQQSNLLKVGWDRVWRA